MKYTPGPWTLDERSLAVFEADGGGLIAFVGDAYPRGTNHPLENMRLVAAAPELLEALQAVLASETWHRWPYILQVRKDVYHRAKDAIKKATQP